MQDRQNQIGGWGGGRGEKKNSFRIAENQSHDTFLPFFAKLSHSDVICYCKGWILDITLWTSIATK
jgi:hypothetical protein